MYSSGAPPLPPGRPPQTVVVPAEFSVQQPLWQNGLQLKKHLLELIEHAVLLKAVYVFHSSYLITRGLSRRCINVMLRFRVLVAHGLTLGLHCHPSSGLLSFTCLL